MGRAKKVIINNYASKKEKNNKVYLIDKEDKNMIEGLIVAAKIGRAHV